jgi:glycosyltransferase involved in cell wall biosynthesis
MHLAIVSPLPPSVTGIGQYGFYISSALARSGKFSRVTVLTSALPNTPHREEQAGMTVERIWTPGHWDIGPKIIARLRALQPDVVWYNLGVSVFGRSPVSNLSGLLGPLFSQQSNFASVITLHEVPAQADLQTLQAPGGPFASLGAWMVTYTATRGDIVCVTLRRQVEWLQQHWPKLRLQHIPHGIFTPPCQLPETDGQELLIFGTFAPFKGLEVLLKAFVQLRGKLPRLRLTVAGMEHPRFPGYLHRIRCEYADIPQIRWLGFVSEGQIAGIFRSSNIVVLPYLATTGSSSVIYRSAAWGRAIVASDLPELHAAAEEASVMVNYFPAGDATRLAEVLIELLADPAGREYQVHHNLAAIRHLTLEDTCASYLRAFDSALALRQERPWKGLKPAKTKPTKQHEGASSEPVA